MKNLSIKRGSTFPFMLSFSAFFCLPTSCFPLDCEVPMSGGTQASENQSPRQTTREHKGVNDKQMKGRISDTCSLPLFLCLPPSPSLSNLYFLSSNSPLPPSLFFFLVHGLATVLTEVDADEVRVSRSYKHRGAPLLSSCLWFLSFSLSVPHTLHRMTMTRTLSTVLALDVCLALCLTLGIVCVLVFLSVCLSVLPASELVCHSL